MHDLYWTPGFKGLDFNENGTLKIIRLLNIHKAHRYDDISIRMIQISDKTLLKSLIILFYFILLYFIYFVLFPDIWKSPNIICVYKKSDKQLVTNY